MSDVHSGCKMAKCLAEQSLALDLSVMLDLEMLGAVWKYQDLSRISIY